MTLARARAKPALTIAGRDLGWLMSLLQATQDTFTVSVVQTTRAVATRLNVSNETVNGAIVQLDAASSAIDVRDLLDRSSGVRFLFIADHLPLRHTVARIIRERGHTVLARDEATFVVAATLTALMAEAEPA
jgi:hypothetical protein